MVLGYTSNNPPLRYATDIRNGIIVWDRGKYKNDYLEETCPSRLFSKNRF